MSPPHLASEPVRDARRLKITDHISKGPLPLVIAVAGHRDLRKQDEEPLLQQVEEIVQQLIDTYPFTPLRLLSGLAEGADRLAARAACELGIELVACLPMTRALYEADFETHESQRKFEQLLSCAADVIELPLINGNTAQLIQEQGANRDKQYQALAEFIVEQSQILIALWDGIDTKLVGGTSWIVQLQLGQCLPAGGLGERSPLDFPETGPVYQIVTPRRKNAIPRGRPYDRINHYHAGFESDTAAEKAYQRIFGRMDLFNRDALRLSGELKGTIERNKERLIPGVKRAKLPAHLQQVIDHYAMADAVALHFKAFTKRSMQCLILGYGLAGLVIFTVFAHGPALWQIPALFLYLVIIALAYMRYRFAKKHELKSRYLDYRAFAEGLRLQIFWKLAGLDHTVANHYLRKQRTELDWIRHATRIWSAPLLRTSIPHDLELVHTHWIERQLKFFQEAAGSNEAYSRWESRWTWGSVCALVTIAAALLILSLFSWFTEQGTFPYLAGHASPTGSHDQFSIHVIAAILMTLLPGIAAAWAAYSLKMAFNEQRKQYARMRDLFQRASSCLLEAITSGDQDSARRARRIVFDLGKEALEENGDWVLLHRERPFELRIGGG
jgi:hypothetical protein